MRRDELKVRRQGLGLTQTGLATALIVRGSTVRNWEQGVHQVPVWVEDEITAMETKKGGK